MAKYETPPNLLDNLLGGGVSIRSQLKYDYSLVPAASRDEVQRAAVTIIKAGRQAQESLIEVGATLIKVKDLLEHGQFSAWCETEFAFSQRTAQNMMNVAAQFGGKSETVSLLSDSTLYLLAAPSTPEAARAAVIEQAQATGQSPTKAQVKAVIAAHKPTAAEQVQALVPAVLQFASTFRTAQGQSAAEYYNPYGAAHSNGQFWPAITKHLKAAGIAYRDDVLKQAIKDAFEQIQSARKAALTVPEDWQVQAIIESMARDEQYNLWPDDEAWLLGQIISHGQRRGCAISEQLAQAQLYQVRAEMAKEEEREHKLARAREAAEQADRERQAADLPPVPADLPGWTLYHPSKHDWYLSRGIHATAYHMTAEQAFEEARKKQAMWDVPARATPKPGELPADLVQRGWQLRQVPGSGRWYGNNPNGPRATAIYDRPEDAIAAMYDMQRDLRAAPVLSVSEAVPPPEPELDAADLREREVFAAARRNLQAANVQLREASSLLVGWHDDLRGEIEEVMQAVFRLQVELQP